MIFALALIQAFGSAIAQYLGTGAGSLLTGFLGGLVSSTATTASLARRSKVSSKTHGIGEMLTFLSATGAMLAEGLLVVTIGTNQTQIPLLVIFAGPMIATLGMIVFHYRSLKVKNGPSEVSNFHFLPILKLSLFIIAILSVSKMLQNLFGQNGLLVLTPLVSLFEIHGSVIANVQLHESGTISTDFLCGLLSISVAASYLSKLFLIFTLGSKELWSRAIKSTAILFCSLAISWVIAISLV